MNELFAVWRTPRIVTENPTRLDNPLWASLVHERIGAYAVNKRFDFPTFGGGPTWCFDRFGQTTTQLADGRTLYLGGEHEDYYDPDFYIYNDAVIVAPDGVAIYGYPRDAFPPTDFHTATLLGEHVWMVGSLGYADARTTGITQVCRLDLATMAIEKLATSGDAPGWIHKHTAELADGAIVVRGGIVCLDDLEENIDEWALDLATLVWTRRTARDWQRWSVARADDKRNLMWELRQMLWHMEHPQFKSGLGEPDLPAAPDLSLLATMYCCEGATLLDERDDEHNVWRIELDGVTVRFTEEGHRIAAMVEGRLSAERLHALQQHVIARASALHFVPWVLSPA